MDLRRANKVLVLALGIAGCATGPRWDEQVLQSLRTAASRSRESVVKLGNGATLVVAGDPDASVAVVRVIYEVGHRDDPSNAHGMAHLAEHLSYEEPIAQADPRTIDSFLRDHALDRTGTVDLDTTEFVDEVPPEELLPVLAAEATRMRAGCEVSPDRFAAETAIVGAEARQRLHSAHTERIRAAVSAHYGNDEAFSWWRAESEAIDAPAVCAFRRT